jgi:hypothetical protein
MSKTKKKGKAADRIAPVVIGIIIVLCSMIPVSSALFGQTGYITEITRTERIGGREDINGQPNAYKWTVAYKFKMKNGEIETGSVTVHGDAISSKSGLRAGSPVRYLAFYPGFNTPGEGGLDGTTVIWIVTIAFGVFMISLGVRKPKPAKTPAQRSREYKAAKAAKENLPPVQAKPPASRVKSAMPINHSGGNKMVCENCGTQLNDTAKFCNNCGASQQSAQPLQQAPASEPDWDSLEYDDRTPITKAEMDELAAIATDEEYEDEFDLINADSEGPEHFRKILAILRWRRANGQ